MSRGVLKPLSYGPFVFLLCFAVQTGAVLILSLFCEDNEPGTALLLTFYTQATACSVAFIFVAFIGGRRDLTAAGFCLKRAGRDSLFAAGSYLWFMVLFVFLIAPLNKLIVGDERQKLVEEIVNRPELLRSAGFLLLVCVAVPLLEEFLFRGILYTGLRAWVDARVAILFSGVIFGVLHGVSAAIPIACFGFFLGYVRERSASLLPAVLVHMVHNGTTLLLLHFLG
jgi:membrane protease YdiL (CAAX protease family)